MMAIRIWHPLYLLYPYMLSPFRSPRRERRGDGRTLSVLDRIFRRAVGHLAASIDVRDDAAVFKAEADAVPAHPGDVWNLHDERRFVAGLERRDVDPRPAAREVLVFLVEQIDDGDHALHRAAAGGIL